MSQAKIGVGIDVGGTFTKVAVVAAQGRALREIQIPTEAGQGAARFVARVCSVLRLLETELGMEAAAIGLGLAGDVDSKRGVLRFAPSLGRWNGFDFKRAFFGKIKRPVVVDNDANMAVWGGYVMELKRRPANVLGVTLGTGVGGGLVLNGKLYRGSTGSAGEVGHTVVESSGRKCRCGARGCLEAYAGGYGIVRRAKELLAARRKSLLRKLCPDPRKLDTFVIAHAAEQGDALARQVWAETGRYLGVGLSNLVLILNPDVVLIVGGVSRAGRLLLDPIRKEMALRPFRTPFDRVSVRIASKPNWGCIGAALLALDNVP